VESIPLSALVPRQDQPRRFFDPNRLRDLAESIRRVGILEPILVRPLGDGRYEIVAGERRYRAAQMAGLSEVPAIILDGVHVQEASVAENLAREDLSPMEAAEGVLALLTARGFAEEEVVGYLRELRSLRKSRHRPGGEKKWQAHPFRGVLEEVVRSVGMTASSFLERYAPLLALPPEVRRVYRDAGYTLEQIRYLESHPEVKEQVLRAYRQAEATYAHFPVLPPGMAVRNLRHLAKGAKGDRDPLQGLVKKAEALARGLERLRNQAARAAEKGLEGAADLEEAADECLERLEAALEGLRAALGRR